MSTISDNLLLSCEIFCLKCVVQRTITTDNPYSHCRNIKPAQIKSNKSWCDAHIERLERSVTRLSVAAAVYTGTAQEDDDGDNHQHHQPQQLQQQQQWRRKWKWVEVIRLYWWRTVTEDIIWIVASVASPDHAFKANMQPLIYSNLHWNEEQNVADINMLIAGI